MSDDNKEKPVSGGQNTGLDNDAANEVSTQTPPKEINIFDRMGEHYASRVKYGAYDATILAKQLSSTLLPDEIRTLLTDPNNTGMYTPNEQHVRNLIGQIAWHQVTVNYEKCVEEISHYILVRHYGNKAVMMHWQGDHMVHQTLPSFRDSQTGRWTVVLNPETGEAMRVLLAKALLNSTQLRSYERVEFLPGKETPPDTLNLWRGWKFPDRPDDSPEEPIWCDLFLDHMYLNLCGGDEELYQYLLGWMADALQNPHRTSRVALVMRGPQGSGKSLFATCFAELFGQHSAVLSRPDQLTGQFNKHLMDKCVVFADEAFFAGNRQQAAALKTLVTSEQIFVEPKGVDGFMAPKFFRLIIATNDEHVIHAEGDDRRFLVLEVDAGAKNNSPTYFAPIIEQWNNGGAAALFNWLRGAYWRNKLESGEWSAEKRPKTRALQQQKDLSLPAPEMAVFNMLREGEPPCDFVVVGQFIFVATSMLAEAARLGTKDLKALGDALRVIATVNAKGQPCNERRVVGREQRRGFLLPPLAIARQKWEAHKNRKVDWPADVSDWAITIGHLPGGDNTPF